MDVRLALGGGVGNQVRGDSRVDFRVAEIPCEQTMVCFTISQTHGNRLVELRPITNLFG